MVFQEGHKCLFSWAGKEFSKEHREKISNALKDRFHYWKIKQPLLPKEILENLYMTEKLSLKKIAKKFNHSPQSIANWLRKYNIPIRTIAEGRSLVWKGEKNPKWRNWISFEPYGLEFNEELKEQIRKRDNYTCQICGKEQEKIKLDVHHIDFNKQNNDKNNLISLCHSCHSKLNGGEKCDSNSLLTNREYPPICNNSS